MNRVLKIEEVLKRPVLNSLECIHAVLAVPALRYAALFEALFSANDLAGAPPQAILITVLYLIDHGGLHLREEDWTHIAEHLSWASYLVANGLGADEFLLCR